MRKRLLHLSLIFFCLAFFDIIFAGQEPAKNGTLIVVYQTGPEGERLDRVRFWLRDERSHFQQLYPKGNSFVEDSKTLTRTVVIDDLSPGNYLLTFLIPNKDAYFEHPEERELTIQPNEVTKVDFLFKKLEVSYFETFQLHDWMEWLAFLSHSTSKDVAQRMFLRREPEMGIMGGALNVESNREDADWVLYNGDRVTYHGIGSISNLVVPAGANYLIRVKQLPGFTAKVYPSSRFAIGRRQSFVARIAYERTYGSIRFTAEIPQEELLSFDLNSPGLQSPIHVDLGPQNGKFEWSSGLIPVGTYVMTFKPLSSGVILSPINIEIQENEQVEVSPNFKSEQGLTLVSNTAEAIYILKQQKSDKNWQGSGTQYTFKGIPPGQYILSFTSSNPDFLVPPEEKRLTIEDKSETVQVSYKITGKVKIETNADRAYVTIISKSSSNPTVRDEIVGGKKVYQLEPGEYQIIVEQQGVNRNQTSQNLSLKEFETQTVQANFKETNTNEMRKEQAQLVIISNLMDAKFKIFKKEDEIQKPVGKYQGKYVSVSLTAKVPYELLFDPLDNYTAPQPLIIELQPGEHRIIRVEYTPLQKLILVPAGKVLLGDTFNEGAADEKPVQTAFISQFFIGTYDVTNTLFAAWLTKAVREGKLIYLSDFEKKGQVIDLEGHLIFKTISNDPYSQIAASQDSEQGIVFRPIPGKDNFPVIDVTWYGAQAYCIANQCRLPTEAEWEKAASMALEKEGEPLKKFRYGFSQDSIDKTWANYKYTTNPIVNFQVLTTEVGFYNGLNLLPLSRNEKSQARTQDAKSPVGAYDMSGNVFQWVADWYGLRQSNQDILNNPKGPSSGKKKVAKGGCYDSLAEELRVSKRLALSPEYCDAYTGFRVAK